MNKSYFELRDKCPACQSGNFKFLYSSPFTEPPVVDYLKSFYNPVGGIDLNYLKGSLYTICECSSCKLIFQKEILNDEGLHLLYDVWMDPEKVKKKHKNLGLDLYANHVSEILMIISFLNKPPTDLKFLDFGLGWAEWASIAKGFGVDSWGTELSRERIEHARKKGINIIEYGEIPDKKFDFINTEQVFEHVTNPLDLMNHLSKGLTQNGVLKISVPSAINIDKRIKKMNWNAIKGSKYSLNPVAPLEHINFFRRSSIIYMAEAVGMQEIRIPLLMQYRFKSNWHGYRKIASNLINPILYNVLKNKNYLFFMLRNTYKK